MFSPNHHWAGKGAGVSVWVWFLWHLSHPSFVPIDPMRKLIPLSEGKVVNKPPDVP